MYTFSKCKVKHLLLSMYALPPIRLDRSPGTVRSVTTIQKAPTVIYTAGASENEIL